MTISRSVLILLLLSSCALAQRGKQARIQGQSATTAQRLDEARALIEKQKWSDALDAIQKVQRELANDLVFSPDSTTHCVSARWMCRKILTSLPEKGLEFYRERTEGRARRLWKEASKRRNESMLRDLIGRYFCSRAAESALLMLGDLAFERGQFDEAEHWWMHLLPTKQVELRLSYPDPKIESALIESRVLLAQWFAGRISIPEWYQSLRAFEKKYPESKGHLAGQTGELAQILAQIAKDEVRAEPTPRSGWSTFAGARSRNRIVSGSQLSPSILSEMRVFGKKWAQTLPGREDRKVDGIQGVSQAARSLAFHPVVHQDRILVCDALTIRAFDLHTGKSKIWHDERDHLKGNVPKVSFPPPPDLRFTLSLGRDCVVARMGTPIVMPPPKEGEKNPPKPPTSSLVCLNLQDQKPRLRWRVTLPESDDPKMFEGTPVVDDNYAYVVVTHQSFGTEITSIRCYPLAGRGKVKAEWTTILSARGAPDNRQSRYLHHFLTLADSTLIHCSSTGAISALNARNGRRLWSVRYHSHVEESPIVPARRDASPAVVVGQRVYVAPIDCDVLMCLDLKTGREIWSRDGVRPQHLLGVGQGRVIFTTTVPIPGIRGVSAADGSDVWYQKGSGSHPPISWGRGLLAGDLILWPTSRRIYALRQIDGEQETTPTLLTGIPTGNLAFAGGAFLVTDRHFLHVLLPPKDEPKKDPKPMPRSTQGARVKIKRVIAHAPKLSLPLKQKWKQELGEGHFLLPADEQKASLIFSCSREGMLSCHDVATFERRWQRLLPFAVSWVALTEKLVFVAGQKGVVSLDREKGAERWRFFAPLQYRSRNAPALSDFRLSRDGLMLYFLQRGRRLFALESSTGKSLWMRQCSGAFLESPHRPFLIEKFELFSDAILVSMLERRRWLLDPKTGESLQEWTDAPGEIRLIREKSGFKIPNQTTLSGQAPRLVDGRFLIVGRNIGWTIHLLKGGKEIWDRPLFLRNDPKESLSWDDESVYLVESGQLRSFSLRDGRRRWSVSLPTIRSSWTTIRNGELILTVPGSRPRSRFSFRLALGAVEWNWRTSSEVKPGLGMPLLIHESRTGKLLQKWNLETSVPVGGSDNLTPQLVFTDQGLVIVDRNRIYRFELSRDQ